MPSALQATQIWVLTDLNLLPALQQVHLQLRVHTRQRLDLSAHLHVMGCHLRVKSKSHSKEYDLA